MMMVAWCRAELQEMTGHVIATPQGAPNRKR